MKRIPLILLKTQKFDTKTLRYSYTSLTTPASLIDYNMETKEQVILKETEVLGGKFDKNNYDSKRDFGQQLKMAQKFLLQWSLKKE